MNINEILKLMDLRIRDNGFGVFDPDTMRAIIAHIRELEARAEKAEAKVAIAKQALEIIAGKSQCIDNLMGNGDVAESALAAMEAADE